LFHHTNLFPSSNRPELELAGRKCGLPGRVRVQGQPGQGPSRAMEGPSAQRMTLEITTDNQLASAPAAPPLVFNPWSPELPNVKLRLSSSGKYPPRNTAARRPWVRSSRIEANVAKGGTPRGPRVRVTSLVPGAGRSAIRCNFAVIGPESGLKGAPTSPTKVRGPLLRANKKTYECETWTGNEQGARAIRLVRGNQDPPRVPGTGHPRISARKPWQNVACRGGRGPRHPDSATAIEAGVANVRGPGPLPEERPWPPRKLPGRDPTISPPATANRIPLSPPRGGQNTNTATMEAHPLGARSRPTWKTIHNPGGQSHTAA